MAAPKKKKEKPSVVLARKGSGTFDDAVKGIQKTYGTDTVGPATTIAGLDSFNPVRTMIYDYDIVQGGGVATGVMHETFGELSSGKTLLATKVAAAFQRMCRNCGKQAVKWNEHLMVGKPIQCCKHREPARVMWIAAEQKSFTNNWAARQGVDPSKVLIVQPQFGEQTIDMGAEMLYNGIDLIVIDSIAQLVPAKEIMGSAEDDHMGLLPRLMGTLTRDWTAAMQTRLCEALPPTVFGLNQIRMKLGVMYGDPETCPGGKAYPFYSLTRNKVKRSAWLKDASSRVLGQEISISNVKNKGAPPLRKGVFEWRSVPGTNRAAGSTNFGGQVFKSALYWGLIKTEGSWYTLAKGIRLNGKPAAQAFLESPDGEKVLDMLYNMAWEREVSWLGGTIDAEQVKDTK